MKGLRRHAPQASQPQDFLASVSDLMSGLIFIFIITVAVFALRLAKTRAELTGADEVRRAVVQSIEEELKKEDIKVIVDVEQGVLRLTDHAIPFARGASEPKQDYRDKVGIVANVLLRVLRCYVETEHPAASTPSRSDRPPFCVLDERAFACSDTPREAKVDTVLIEGHTDSVPIGGASRFKDNLDLSAARSATVFRMMQQCEPELTGLVNRSRAPVISVSGYGEARPIQPLEPEADANRRIDLRFLMEPPHDRPEQVPSVPRPAEDTREALGP